MTGALVAAGLAATLIAGAAGRAPASPWRVRADRREAAELAAWAEFRAAFEAPLPPRPAERIPLELPTPRRRPPRAGLHARQSRIYVLRDPIVD